MKGLRSSTIFGLAPPPPPPAPALAAAARIPLQVEEEPAPIVEEPSSEHEPSPSAGNQQYFDKYSLVEPSAAPDEATGSKKEIPSIASDRGSSTGAIPKNRKTSEKKEVRKERGKDYMRMLDSYSSSSDEEDQDEVGRRIAKSIDFSKIGNLPLKHISSIKKLTQKDKLRRRVYDRMRDTRHESRQKNRVKHMTTSGSSSNEEGPFQNWDNRKDVPNINIKGEKEKASSQKLRRLPAIRGTDERKHIRSFLTDYDDSDGGLYA